MDIAYVAHTEACTFLLDADGVCRWYVAKADANEATLSAAKRCVGSQYVASLDPSADGLLAHAPKVGTRLIFAHVGDKGRVALVRSGPLVRFEELDAPMSVADVTERDVAPKADTDEASVPPTRRVTDADEIAARSDAKVAGQEVVASDAQPTARHPNAPEPSEPKDEPSGERHHDPDDFEDVSTAPWSRERPLLLTVRRADDTEPPTVRRAPPTAKAFPPPPPRALAAPPPRRGMLPRRRPA